MTYSGLQGYQDAHGAQICMQAKNHTKKNKINISFWLGLMR